MKRKKRKEKVYAPPKATNIVKGFLKGLPCMYGDILCRMVAVHPQQGKYKMIDGILTHTNPLILTPHGTALNPSYEYVSEITEAKQIELLAIEKEIKDENGKLYDGYLKESEYLSMKF